MPKRVPAIVKSHHGPLKMLSKARKRNFNLILNTTPKIAKAIKTLFRLILDQKGPLQAEHTDKLRKHKQFIRRVAHGPDDRVIPHIQKGGSIFKTILSVALPFLSSLI